MGEGSFRGSGGKEENMGEEWGKSVRWGEERIEENRMEGRGRCVDWGGMGYGVWVK